MEWQNPEINPDIPIGTMKCFIVAVKRKNGEVHTFPAMYLNAYRLIYEDTCPHCAEIPEHDCGSNNDDGCPTTGWFEDEASDDYDRLYMRIQIRDGEEFMGWQPLPKWTDTPTA